MLCTLRHIPLLLPILVTAQPGTLDPNFSEDGLFTQEVSAYDDVVNAVLVQPDGKIVGTGTIDDGSFVYSFVQRLTSAGTPDNTFGIGGVQLLAVAGQQPFTYAVGLQSDGAILVAGLIYDMNLDGNAFVMRVLSNGTLDTDFGTDGIASLNFGTEFGFQSAWAMRVMDDDRIVLVGEDGENGVACARLTADGAMDPSFGNGGLVYTGIPFGSGLSMYVYDDGSVLAGGYRLDGGSDLLLARFDVDGVLDPAFGTDGVALLDLQAGDTEFMRGIDVLPDGRIAVCGSRSFNGLDDEPVVAMFNADGTLDADFGNAGLQVLAFTAPQWGQARGIMAQADGKLLVCGFRAQPGGVANNDFFLYRLLDDGSFDPSFASAGQVFTDVSGAVDRGMAMALAPDGAVVVAGFGTTTSRLSAYARYMNDIGTAVVNAVHSSPSMSVYPQPAADRISVRLNSERPMHTIRLLDAKGHVVLTQWAGPFHTHSIELSAEVANGSYVLEVNTDGEVLRAPLLVVR